eukprot:TRINITY_DN22962_c0_g1_i1.p1 TRINITY_DN22962_c0_g1~~TRINITY_DN22962_c0_g1_i1.p1  ORF type:complete len:466 (+),score=81.08 TRINITY_DN22962_c0_g1_i1:82-1479(+)
MQEQEAGDVRKLHRRVDDVYRLLSGDTAESSGTGGGTGGGGGAAGGITDEEAHKQAEVARTKSLPHLLQLLRSMPVELQDVRQALRADRERLDLIFALLEKLRDQDLFAIRAELKTLREKHALTSEQVDRCRRQVDSMIEWRAAADELILGLQRDKADRAETDSQFVQVRRTLAEHTDGLEALQQEAKRLDQELRRLLELLEALRTDATGWRDDLQQKIDAIVARVNDILSVLVLFENKLWDDEQKMGKMEGDIRRAVAQATKTVLIRETEESHAPPPGAADSLIRKKGFFRCLSCDRDASESEVVHANQHPVGKNFSSHLGPRPQKEFTSMAARDRDIRERVVREVMRESATSPVSGGAALTPTRPLVSPERPASAATPRNRGPGNSAEKAPTKGGVPPMDRLTGTIPIPNNITFPRPSTAGASHSSTPQGVLPASRAAATPRGSAPPHSSEGAESTLPPIAVE